MLKSFFIILLYVVAVLSFGLLLLSFWLSFGYFFYLIIKSDFSFGVIVWETIKFFISLLLIGFFNWWASIIGISLLDSEQ